jgi:DNA-binding MarR family transcriptional regulator
MDTEIQTPMLQSWRVFLTAQTRILERLSHALESEVDLPLAWYDVLLTLNEAEDGRLRMHQLADSLLLSRSAATRFIDRMEAAGLVERIQCLTDGRGTFVRLSAAGRKRFETAAPIYRRGVEEYFGRHVADAERQVIDPVMERLVDNATTTAGAS